jgi:hypothetical protein
MALDKKFLSKMKKAMPMKGKAPDEQDADPAFEIDDTEDGAGDGDVDNMSRNDSPDADADERQIARAKDGTSSEVGEGDEGSQDHEEQEGPAEEAAEHSELDDVSDDDLLHALKRRGHPAGDYMDSSEGVDEPVSKRKGY